MTALTTALVSTLIAVLVISFKREHLLPATVMIHLLLYARLTYSPSL